MAIAKSARIADHELLEALKFDGSSASALKAYVERAILAEGRLKRAKALEMQKASHLPLSAQEREAYASEAYEAALAEEAEATALLEELRAARAHARLTIDIWRALQTSHRVVSLS